MLSVMSGILFDWAASRRKMSGQVPMKFRRESLGGRKSQVVCAGALCLLVVGCESGTTYSSRATSAPSSPLGAQEALRAAYTLERFGDDRTSGLGRGDSMQPLYDSNTVIVVEKIAYEDLKAGMLVAYRNSQGARVVHQLLYQDHHGWVAQGIGNEGRDRDRVTRANLEGVVYGAFFSTD
jgi:hypothetical protein